MNCRTKSLMKVLGLVSVLLLVTIEPQTNSFGSHSISDKQIGEFPEGSKFDTKEIKKVLRENNHNSVRTIHKSEHTFQGFSVPTWLVLGVPVLILLVYFQFIRKRRSPETPKK